MHTPDPDILEWAAGEDRQIFTRDRGTMTDHAYDRVVQGLPMPGVFVIAEDMPVGQAVKELGDNCPAQRTGRLGAGLASFLAALTPVE